MRILGIELGGWSVKAVELESRFRRMEVIELHEVKLPLQPADPTAAYQKAVSELIARLPMHPEKIVTSLPAAHTSLRIMQIPVKQRKKVEQSFRFELEDAVPFKLEDAIVEHHVKTFGDGSLVLAAIAPKRHIVTYIDWLKTIGLDPDWLTFEGMGLMNLYFSNQASKKPEEKDQVPVLLLDIGHTKTNMAICHQGRLEFLRNLSWGGLSISQSIATGLVINLEQAEQKKIRELRIDEEAPIPNTEVEELISSGVQAFTPFITDLSHTLVTYRSQFKTDVGKILLTGGTAKLNGIDDFLSKQLNLPVQFYKPFKDVSFSKNVDVSQEMRFGETLGRALVFNRKSDFLFNFRQEDLAKTTSIREMGSFLRDPNVLTLLRYVGIFALMLFIAAFPLKYVASESATKATSELRKIFSDTFKEVAVRQRTTHTADPQALKKFIDQKTNELNQRLKLASSNQTPMLGLIRAVSDCFPPPPAVEIDVNNLSLDDRALKIEGVLYKGSLTQVTESLKKLPPFKNITVEIDGQRFTYKGEVVRK